MEGEEQKFTVEYGEQEFTLRDCVEMYALGICEDVMKNVRARDITRKCKILDSLTNALVAINS